MTPIVILFWPAAGILLRWLVPLMLLDAGRERWARAAGPGPWPARLALFAAVLAPFAAGGVWAPRLMLLAVGYAAGWDAIPRPHHGTRRDRPVRTRVPWAAMTGQGHITIRPFLIGHGVFDADPARYFHRDASWRRDRSPFRYSERSLVMGRTAGDSAAHGHGPGHRPKRQRMRGRAGTARPDGRHALPSRPIPRVDVPDRRRGGP